MKKATFITHEFAEIRRALQEEYGVRADDASMEFSPILEQLAQSVGVCEDRLNRGETVSASELREASTTGRLVFLALTGIETELPSGQNIEESTVQDLMSDLFDALCDTLNTIIQAMPRATVAA
jgi:hypothetical protein